MIETEFNGPLAMEDLQWLPPTVSDLATPLARAMSRPPRCEDRQRAEIGITRHVEDRRTHLPTPINRPFSPDCFEEHWL